MSVGVLVFGLALGWMQTKALLAEFYRQTSLSLISRNPGSSTALKAAEISINLEPWHSDIRAETSWQLQNSGNSIEARRQFAAALSTAPADAYLWAEYAQLLARQSKFGREMEFVTRVSNRLGPTSAAIQLSNADTGLYFWSRGSSALQQEWRSSMNFMLRNDRVFFLQRVRESGRIGLFCLGPGAQLALSNWCTETEPTS